MNVYKEGFCKWLTLSTYMSSYSGTKDDDICKSTREQLKSFGVNHKKQMSSGHFNINSLRNKFFDFKDMLADNVIDIVFLSETKLDEIEGPRWSRIILMSLYVKTNGHSLVYTPTHRQPHPQPTPTPTPHPPTHQVYAMTIQLKVLLIFSDRPKVPISQHLLSATLILIY